MLFPRAIFRSNAKHQNVWLYLTLPIGVLLVAAAGGGIFVGGLYRDTPYYTVMAVGQDVISLVLVVPVVILSAWLAYRSSARAMFVWLGCLIYVVYTYAIAAFDNQFNSLFLIYVGLFGLSLYALIGGFLGLNKDAVKLRFTERTPVRALSLYLAALAILFYLMWLSEVVPALLAGKIPLSVKDSGTPTNAVHVLDMAWILPAFGITALNLWRRRSLGYLLAGPLISFASLLAAAVLSMVATMVRAGYPVALPQVVLFIALFALSFGMLIWYMASLKSPRISEIDAVEVHRPLSQEENHDISFIR